MVSVQLNAEPTHTQNLQARLEQHCCIATDDNARVTVRRPAFEKHHIASVRPYEQ
jgi:hypothetical protein